MNGFLKRELAKFEKWFAVYGKTDLCREAQWVGFRGRAHLASKGQNDPSQEKEYRITYLDEKGDQKCVRKMASSPKAAMAMVESEHPDYMALYGKRPTIYEPKAKKCI